MVADRPAAYSNPAGRHLVGRFGRQRSPTVVEKGFAFDPATLDVKVGDTVTFKNEDSAPHNVKIDGKELGAQDPGAA